MVIGQLNWEKIDLIRALKPSNIWQLYPFESMSNGDIGLEDIPGLLIDSIIDSNVID